jgi:anti-sigma B factor antagonist
MSQIRHGRRSAGTAGARSADRGAKPSGTADRVGARCHLEAARVGSAAYLMLVGELDLSCNERFVASLRKVLADPPTDLVIDLRSLTFIDSTGLALLVKANTLTREEEIRLHIVRSSAEIVRAVLEASGLDKILPIVDQPPRLRPDRG